MAGVLDSEETLSPVEEEDKFIIPINPVSSNGDCGKVINYDYEWVSIDTF